MLFTQGLLRACGLRGLAHCMSKRKTATLARPDAFWDELDDNLSLHASTLLSALYWGCWENCILFMLGGSSVQVRL